jgi:hypothetical protein
VIFRILADIVLVVHLLWIVFLIFGVIPGVRIRSVKIIHLTALAFALIIQIFGWYCPLTHLEIWLRNRHDPGLSYSGSFIVHYIEKVVYLDVSFSLIFALTIILILITIVVYTIKRPNNDRGT